MKTIVINLVNRTDRKEEVIKEFQRINLTDYEFYPAVKPDIKDVPKTFLPQKSTNYRRGCWGVLQSHLSVIKIAKERGYPEILICEDDVQFLVEKPFEKIEKSLSELPSDWVMLFLSGNHKKPCNKFTNNTVKINYSYSLCSYILNNNYYDLIINLLSNEINIIEEIDIIYAKQIQSKFNCYCITPHITTQRPSYSDILEKKVDYKNVLKNPLIK